MTDTTTRKFDYKSFIEELLELMAKAQSFGDVDRRHDSDAFIDWRTRVKNLSYRIGRTHMDSTIDLYGLQFRVMASGRISPEDQIRAFDRDLNTVLAAMKRVVQHYEKYGEPEMFPLALQRLKKQEVPASEVSTKNPVEPVQRTEWPSPDVMTLPWIFKYTPLGTWVAFGSFVVAVFVTGVTVGSWNQSQKFRDDVNAPIKASSSPTQPVSSKK